MPTPRIVFAQVAATLSGIDPLDEDAVTGFYEHRFGKYPAEVTEMISEFIISATARVTDDDLMALKEAVDRLTSADCG
jgi:hypothetical protein